MKKILFLLICLAPFSSALAQTSTGTVVANGVSVRSEPNKNAEVLLQLDKGKSVTILEQKGEWYRVSVRLDASFSFKGWVHAKFIKSKLPPPPKKAAPVVAAPAPQRAPASPTPAPRNDQLDQFFAPAPAPTPVVVRTPAPAPVARAVVPPPPPAFTPAPRPTPRPKPKSVVVEQEEDRPHVNLGERFRIGAGIGYLLSSYSLKSGATKVFSYSLPGLGIEIDGRGWFWGSGRMRLGGSFDYTHGFFNNTTSIQDSTGTVQSGLKTSSSSDDIIVKALFGYNLSDRERSSWVGASAGMEYFKFKGDDVSDTTSGTPLQLYTSFTTLSGLIGLEGWFYLGSAFLVGVGSDVMIFSSASESPKDQTGTSPSASIGFTPFLSGDYTFGGKHHVGAEYRLRSQSISFSGTGSRVGTSNVTDGKASTLTHNFFVSYAYSF